jgi:hypothetical protein
MRGRAPSPLGPHRQTTSAAHTRTNNTQSDQKYSTPKVTERNQAKRAEPSTGNVKRDEKYSLLRSEAGDVGVWGGSRGGCKSGGGGGGGDERFRFRVWASGEGGIWRQPAGDLG